MITAIIQMLLFAIISSLLANCKSEVIVGACQGSACVATEKAAAESLLSLVCAKHADQDSVAKELPLNFVCEASNALGAFDEEGIAFSGDASPTGFDITLDGNEALISIS